MTANTTISAVDLAKDASWLPHRLDMAKRTVQFGRFDHAALRKASFLDYRIEPAALAWTEVTHDALLSAASALPAKKPGFLFHTSYCCSTLLSRALDRPGSAMVLKEPEIIMGLSNAYRMAQDRAQVDYIDKLRDALFAFAARPHVGDENILIKPTNAANNIVPIVAALKTPAVLLYGDLREFLTSVIKKGDPCKTLVRQIYRVYAMDNIGVAAIPQRDALALTDLQIAALVWRHQIELFNAVLGAPEATSLRSLNFRTLLERPAQTLEAASSHFNTGYDAETCRAVAEGALFQTDAKDDARRYDAEQRKEEERRLMEQHSDALDLIEDWAFKLSLWPARTKKLPSRLID